MVEALILNRLLTGRMTPARPFPTSGSAREIIQWPRCQTRKRSNGKTDFYHSMLAATVVPPGHNMVVPLTPEFIVKPDGAEKQDCEHNAAKHWLAAHAARATAPRPVYLVACQPVREAVLASGAEFLFMAKERRRATARAPDVNWIGLTISDAKGKTTYDGAFVTSLEVITSASESTSPRMAKTAWGAIAQAVGLPENRLPTYPHSLAPQRRALHCVQYLPQVTFGSFFFSSGASAFHSARHFFSRASTAALSSLVGCA